MVIEKPQFCHGNVANAPKLVSVQSTQALTSPRLFQGAGAPAAASLAAGNGMYCGAGNGFVLEVSIANGGLNFLLGDVLNLPAGKITVDAVDGTGKILDARVSTPGFFAAYPANPVAVTGGAGAGATFNLVQQAPDFYWDATNKNLYLCVTGGTNATSVWQQINTTNTPGGSWASTWDPTLNYAAGALVRVTSVYKDPVSGVQSTMGVFGCKTKVDGTVNSTNRIPQFPEPVVGIVYWELVTFTPQVISSCQNGTVNIYIMASGPF